MKLYAYCVSRESEENEAANVLDPLITGVAGSLVRFLRVGKLQVFVSEFNGAGPAVTRENVLAHEAVVRGILQVVTPLPFRFGTVVSEIQLKDYLESQEASLLEKLAFVEDSVEMSVKIIWQPDLIKKTSADGHSQEGFPKAGRSETERENSGAGVAFLMSKQRELVGDQFLADKAKELAEWLNKRLGSTVRKELAAVRPTEKLVLSAAYLVPRAGLEGYRRQLKRACVERPDLRFLTSGPWAPYSFVNIDLEFKTYFGVS